MTPISNNHPTIYVNYQGNSAMRSKIIQTEESKIVHPYPGDLSAQEKSKIDSSFSDENTLNINFYEFPYSQVTIRRQDIFTSDAEVIVNAANTHLGGGGGIDGAIHAKGGNSYASAHNLLQKQYHAQYVSGHAAMIESGSLKAKYGIDNVIVIAGPKDESTFEKECELYSCYYNSLELAEAEKKSSIAFPSISTGIYNFPRDRAACISLRAIHDFLIKNQNKYVKNISIHFLPNEPKDYLENYLNI